MPATQFKPDDSYRDSIATIDAAGGGRRAFWRRPAAIQPGPREHLRHPGRGAGLVGQSLRLAGLQQSLSITSGVLILLLVAVPGRYTARLAAALGLGQTLAWVKTTLAGLYPRPSPAALSATGLLNSLLPCGLVYLALAGALSAPGVAAAAAYMACFGLSTRPLMLGLSLSGRLVPLGWRTPLGQAVPYAASVLAVLFIVRGPGLGIPYLSPQLRTAAAAARAHQPLTVHFCH